MKTSHRIPPPKQTIAPVLRRNKRQHGIGLIEVLIALVVLSVGFLAAATIQISSMRSNQQSGLEAQALVLIGDMMDRMSANRAGVDAGLYNNKSTSTLTAPTCLSTSCTPAEVAAVDLFEWSANFESLRSDSNFKPLMPSASNGDPAVGTISNPTAGLYTLSVTWKQFQGTTEVDESVSVSFIP